jgi:predicted nucleic acid-binding protein
MGVLMKELVIIDTDILIDVARDVSEATGCLREIEHNAIPAISAVTQMELMIGCRNKKELKALDRFLSRFTILKTSEAISERAVGLIRRYRLSHGILISDALIAATALNHDRPLISKNQRDYRFIEELALLGYPNPVWA